MTMPNPVSSLERLKHKIKKNAGSPFLADLIADNGEIFVQNNPGFVWVREILSYEEASGKPVYGQAFQVRSIGTYPVSYGQPVRVEYDVEDDEWGVTGADFNGMVRLGINPAILNPLNPYTKFIDLSSLPPLKTFAVSNGNTATTEVGVKNFVYINSAGILQAFSLDPLDRPNIGDYAPGVGLKRLVHLWLNSSNTISVTTSTPINIALPFDITIDLAECINTPPDNVSIPIGAWKIQYGQTSITESDLYFDTRQWINSTPTGGILGFPNPVTQTTIIEHGRTVTHAGDLSITTGNLVIQGDLIQLDGGITTSDITRITSATYTILNTDTTIFANTDSNAIAITLQPGVLKRYLRIKNTGTSSNNLTITPSGAENLLGANSSFTLFDAEDLVIQYETTDGWY